MSSESRARLLEPKLGTGATLLGLILATLAAAALEPLGKLVALPGLWFWIAVMTLALAVPFFVQWRDRVFEPFTPVTYPIWTYLGPVFVIGSAVLAGGVAKQVPDLIPPPVEQHYCVAMAYLVVGWLSLLVGYYARWGERLGAFAQTRLPRAGWGATEIRIPAAMLLAVGLGFHVLAVRVGVVGHQRLETVGPYDSLLIFLSFISYIAAFLLWFSLFARPIWSRGERALAAGLLLLGPLNLVLTASRAGLLTNLLILAAAFCLAGRRVRWRNVVLFGVLSAASLAVGTSWSTTYRAVKGNEDPIFKNQVPVPSEPTVSEPTVNEPAAAGRSAPSVPRQLLVDTARATAERDLHDQALFIFRNLAVRLEITSSVATLVANYKRLRPLEQEHGLAGNIWRDTWTAPIPRFLWPGKPIIADARTYGLVYFNYSGNSFAVTPVGDLLRNFGPLGVALGMALLGFALRFLHVALVGGQTVPAAQAAIYTIVLMNVSYEAFYSSILPTVMRLFVVAGSALLAVHLGVLVVRRFRGRDRP